MVGVDLVPAFLRRSFIRKASLVILVVLVALVGVGLYTNQQVSATVTEQRNEQLSITTAQEADSLGRWVERQRTSVDQFSQNSKLQFSREERRRELLETELTRLPESALTVSYVNLNLDTVITATQPDDEGAAVSSYSIPWSVDEAENGSVALGRNGSVLVSDVFTYRGTPVVAFGAGINATSNAVIAFYNVERRSDELETSVAGGTTAVVNADRTVQLAENVSQVGTAYGGGATETDLRTALDGNGSVGLRDDVVVGFTQVPNSDWVLVKDVPQSAAYALRGEVQRNMILLILTAIAGIGALAVLVGRDAMTSLVALSRQADAIAQGEIDAEIADQGRVDEVGQVRDSFQAIQAYLQTVADQADALANQEFDDPVLDEEVPGRLGASLNTMRRDLQSFIDELESAQIEAEQSRKEAEAIADDLEENAEEVREIVEAAAEGDLTRRLDEEAENESMVAIEVAFNDLLDELDETMQRIDSFAADVDESSDEITATAEEIKGASTDVSDAVQEMADGARRQDDLVQQASGEMTDLSATIEEVASSSDEVAVKSRSAADAGDAGRERAQAAIEEMNAIERRAAATIEDVEELEAEMERIGEIVDLIDEIADQTNMLALNASIEAARAGEAGEGFAVVADEIKQLAEETTEATQEIDELIADVQASTGDTVQDIREMDERLGEGLETVGKTVETLDDVVDQVEEANVGVQSINDATDEQATTTEEVVTLVEEVGDISADTTSRAENAAAAAQEQSASITEVTSRIQTLSEQSGDLRELLDQFALDATDAEADGYADRPTDTSEAGTTGEVGEESAADSGSETPRSGDDAER
jgi:methyl-accepting chemotaxis protein